MWRVAYDPSAQDRPQPPYPRGSQPYPPQQPYPYQGRPEYGTYPTGPQPPIYPAAPATAAPVRRRSRRATVVVAIVAAGLTFGGLGLVVAALTHDTSSSTSAAGGGTAPARSVATWRDGGGAALVKAITEDFVAISFNAKSLNATTTHASCTKLQTDVEAAQAYQQIPDRQAQTAWAAALALYARAATDCVSGTTGGFNAALISKSGDELAQGNTQLEAVTARVRALGGT